MLTKIAIKNVKRSFKDYIVYFLTLMLSVSIFFVFNSIDSPSPALAISDSQRQLIDIFGKAISGLSIFISIVLGFLIVYANGFMIKRRKKEFGTYLLLGMSKKKVSLILTIETLIVGLSSLAAGLIVGTFASQFMTNLIAKQLEISLDKFLFTFSFSTCIETIISFGIIFLAVMVFNIFSLSRCKLINLLYASKFNQKLKIKKLWLTVTLFIISIIMLGTSYYIILNNPTNVLDSDDKGLKIVSICIISICIGIFLLFMSLSELLLKISQKNKRLYYKNLNIFNFKQINSKINSTHLSMTIVSLLMIVALITMPIINMSSDIVNKDIDARYPADVYISACSFDNSEGNIDIQDPEEILREKGVNIEELNSLFSHKTEYTYANVNCLTDTNSNPYSEELFKSPLYISTYIKETDYNKVVNDLNIGNEVHLNDNEFSIAINTSNIKDIDHNIDILVKYSKFALEQTAKENIKFKSLENLSTNPMLNNSAFIIVSDNFAAKNLEYHSPTIIGYLKPDKKDSNLKLEEVLSKGNIKLQHPESFQLDNHEYCIDISSRISYLSENKIIMFFEIAIGAYIGIIFLLAGVTVLAIQQLSEASDNNKRYLLLKKLGVSNSSIRKAVLFQVSTYFLIPLAVAIINAILGILKFNNMIHAFNFSVEAATAILPFVALILIYLAYFLVTYFGCERLANLKK